MPITNKTGGLENMAMKDTKSIPVTPGEQDETITLFSSFGWEYKNATEVATNDSQILTGRDEEYEHYKIIPGQHYIRLFFERDRSRQNYEELKKLEEEYFGLKEPSLWEKPQLITKLWLILIGVGLLLYVLPGIILLVIHIVKYVKDTKFWNSSYERYQTEMTSFNTRQKEILDKAQALV